MFSNGFNAPSILAPGSPVGKAARIYLWAAKHTVLMGRKDFRPFEDKAESIYRNYAV